LFRREDDFRSGQRRACVVDRDARGLDGDGRASGGELPRAADEQTLRAVAVENGGVEDDRTGRAGGVLPADHAVREAADVDGGAVAAEGSFATDGALQGQGLRTGKDEVAGIDREPWHRDFEGQRTGPEVIAGEVLFELGARANHDRGGDFVALEDG